MVWGAAVAVGISMRVGIALSPGTAPISVGVIVKVGVGGVGEMVGVLLGVWNTTGVDVSTGDGVGVTSNANMSLNEQAVKVKAKIRLKNIFLIAHLRAFQASWKAPEKRVCRGIHPCTPVFPACLQLK